MIPHRNHFSFQAVELINCCIHVPVIILTKLYQMKVCGKFFATDLSYPLLYI